MLQNHDGTNIKYSQYSTFSIPSKPFVYSEQNYLNNNTYDYTQNNNIVEYSPVNKDIFTSCSNNIYSYAQPIYDYNNNNYNKL